MPHSELINGETPKDVMSHLSGLQAKKSMPSTPESRCKTTVGFDSNPACVGICVKLIICDGGVGQNSSHPVHKNALPQVFNETIKTTLTMDELELYDLG